jgi:uncharacterized protein YcfL
MKHFKTLILPFILVGCASYEPAAVVDRKVKEEQTVKVVEASDTTRLETAIKESKKLSDGQKMELATVIHSYKDTNNNLLSERQKYRKVLLKEMLGKNDKDQVQVLRTKIATVENQRVDNFMTGITQFQTVLKESDAKQEIMERAMEMDANFMSGSSPK